MANNLGSQASKTLRKHIYIDSDVREYLKEAGKQKLLTVEEEHEAAILAQKGYFSAIDTLIKSNLLLVYGIAIRHVGRCHHLKLSDLIQEGNYGLMKAARNFDPMRGTRFYSYASWYIDSYIRRAIQQQEKAISIPINEQEAYIKYKEYIELYNENSNDIPADEVIMKECKISVDQLDTSRNYKNYNALSLNQKVGVEKDTELLSFIPDTRNAFNEFQFSIDDKILLLKIKESLSDYEYYILYCRVFANPIKKLREIAEEFGKHEQSVSKTWERTKIKIATIIEEHKKEEEETKEPEKTKKKTILFFKRYSIREIDDMEMFPEEYELTS